MNTILKDFTIGADPEFICTKGNSIIRADDWVGDFNNEDFGADGNHVTFELRPAPSVNPLDVVNNIHDIFVRKVIEQPQFLRFNWHAGSWYKRHPLGGHVHFGIMDNEFQHSQAVNVLDNYVGLISLLLEKKDDAIKRRNDTYGHMGCQRPQDWGFEYRPMSSWLSSPYVASSLLCLSKVVMYEALNNDNFVPKERATPAHFAFVQQDKIKIMFPEIWKEITKMHLYQTYKPYIDLIYFMIKNNYTWITTTPMKECWGVTDMTPCIINKANINVLWNRFEIEG